jgi:hypothetical protein
MKRLVQAGILAALLAVSATPASALVLLDQTDATVSETTSVLLTFVSTATSTSISISGYDVPTAEYLDNVAIQMNGSGTNLLDGNYAYTPASSGSSSSQIGNSLSFEGTTIGSYDTYTANLATTPGSYYTLSYDFSELFQDGEGIPLAPNGLLITASNASSAVTSIAPISTAPEAATWLMMILGFGAIGAVLRRAHCKSEERLCRQARAIAAA